MKVVLLTRAMASANALCRRMAAENVLHLVVCEDFGARKRTHLSVKGLMRTGKRVLRERVLDVPAANRERAAIELVYGARAAPLPELSLIRTEHRSWNGLIRVLEDVRPDVILSYGTSLLPEALYRLAKIAAMNIHAGLAPYYRGMFCVEQAILHHDPANIGATVHLLRPRIDAGEIVVHGRPQLFAGDDENVVQHRVLDLGQQLAVEVLARLKNGGTLSPQPQDLSRGQVYLSKLYTREKQRELRKLIADGLLRRYLERPESFPPKKETIDRV